MPLPTLPINRKDDNHGRTLHWAVQRNNVALVGQMLSEGADVNARDTTYNQTPLYYAADNSEDDSHLKVAEMLLKKGAEVDARSNDGRTALHLLVKKSNTKTVQLFLKFKADVNVKDTLTFKTPLHYAAISNVDESLFGVLEVLLKNRAIVDARDAYARTPLYYLVVRGNVKIVELFWHFRADFKLVDREGESLIFPATYNRNVDVVQLLMDKRLRIDSRKVSGETPLHIACKNVKEKDIEIVKFLLKRGASLSTIDQNGFSPLNAVVRKYSASTFIGKIVKDNFNFILEHTDFSFNHHYIDIFLSDALPQSMNIQKLILDHVARLQILEVPVHQALKVAISTRDEHSDYYKQCQDELLRGRNTKLPNSWITYYNLVVTSRRQLKNYAGNEDLCKNFKQSDCIEKFPIYGTLMSDNFKKGIKKRELFDKSTVMLSDCLPVFGSMHLVITGILDCIMGKKDLSKFCNSMS